MKIPDPIKFKEAEVEFKVVFDVPANVYMQDKNDCWLVVLQMMEGFLKPANPGYSISADQEKDKGLAAAGSSIPALRHLMNKNGFSELPGGYDRLKDAGSLSMALLSNGPIVTAISIDQQMLHAVIVTGVKRTGDTAQVYVLNPGMNFLSAAFKEYDFGQKQSALNHEMRSRGLKEATQFGDWKNSRSQPVPIPRPAGGGSSLAASPTSSPGPTRKVMFSESPRSVSPPPSPLQTARSSSGSARLSQGDDADAGAGANRLEELRAFLNIQRIGMPSAEHMLELQYLEEMQETIPIRQRLRLVEFFSKVKPGMDCWTAADVPK